MNVRPTFLMAEVEPLDGVSARKLVLETAKFKVITAHTSREAEELIHKFPKINAIILHSSLKDFDCDRIVAGLKQSKEAIPVIVLTPTPGFRCDGADHHVPSHEPQELLALLRELFGDPRAQEAA